MGVINKIIVTAGLLLLTSTFGFAQSVQKTPLEKEITISINNEKADGILQRIERLAEINFSYNPSIFDLDQDYSGSFENKTVREVLNELFPGELQLKEKGNYVILTQSPEAKKEGRRQSLVISGYVVDSQTGDKIREASVYNKRTLSAAITNEFGFFKLEINKPEESNELTISKKGYFDQTLAVQRNSVDLVTISINPETPLVNRVGPEDLDKSEAAEPVIVKEIRPARTPERTVMMTNISDTLYRKFQISLFPFVGTNGALSGNVINDYSINVFGGYSMGNSKLEVGGYFNINRAYMHGVQLAGVFNYVGGDVSGLQGAGYANIVRGEAHAWQLAGYTNINFGKATKPQISGFLNLNLKESKSLHASGFANIHGKQYEGTAITGLANLNLSESSGVMAAGMANLQIGNYKGFMVSGLTNVTLGRMEGVQLTGLLNVSGKLKGSQIGFLNIADSVSGVQVGFLSFSRAGYHKIEISADEIFYTNLALRTGSSNAFYNIFTAGIKPQGGTPFWSYGYGIGTSPRLTKWLYLNADLTAHQVQKGRPVDEFHLLSKLYLGLEFQIMKRFSITGGATLNSYLTKNTFIDYPYLFTDYTPNFIVDENYQSSDLNNKMWIGWKFGLRFL